KTGSHIDENLSDYSDLSQLVRWNFHSPVWAPITISKAPNGQNALKLSDKDPYDFAKAEHVFAESEEFTVEFCVLPAQNKSGSLIIELQDEKNAPGIRLAFESDGVLQSKRKHRHRQLLSYEAGKEYCFQLYINTKDQSCKALVNGQSERVEFDGPIKKFSRIGFKTGESVKVFDNDLTESPDVANAGIPAEEFSFHILSLKTIDGIKR